MLATSMSDHFCTRYIILAEAWIALATCTTFGLCFPRGVFFRTRVTGACPVTTDLIMRVNVKTSAASFFFLCQSPRFRPE